MRLELPLSTETVVNELQKLRFRGKTGSSYYEVDKCTSLALLYSIFTVFFVNILFQTSKTNYSFLIFIFEFFACIFPLVVSLTYLSDYIFHIYGILVSIVVAFCFWLLRKRNLWAMLVENVRVKDDKLPCITHFRGLVNMYSVICILAADFEIFPERFLKTEYYGISLMDTGVGLFVVAFGIGSSHNRLRPINLSTFFKHFILLSIGIGRFLAVRSVDYHHQVSEYGVHWNFFITFALIGIFNEFLFRLTNSTKGVFIFSIVLLVSYEIALNMGLRDWIFGSAPRDTFISANREGICSMVGYEILYLWGVVMRRLLPKKGDSFKQYHRASYTYLQVFLLQTLFRQLTYSYFPPSRRCANFGYVLCIMSIALFYMAVLIIFELVVLLWNVQMKIKIHKTTPFILDAVNFNGLLFFLVGNLLTGLINLSMYTLLVYENSKSLTIITLYIFTCCSVTSLLYAKQRRIP